MSWLRPRDGRERREQIGRGRLNTYLDNVNNQRIYQPSDEGLECRMDVPVREMIHETGPMYPVHGQQKLPFAPPRNPSVGWQERRRLPLERDSSPGWQEERRLPPQRRPSPGGQEERRLPPQRRSSPGWQERRRLPLERDSSPGWQTEIRLPPQRRSSPGWQDVRRLPQANPSCGWHDERPLADSDTLPARWRNAQPATKETRDNNQGQPTSHGAKVHFLRPVARRQRTPEDDDEEEESGSSSASSLGGSVSIIENGDSKPDDRNLNLSYCLDFFEDVGAGSGDEDDFVHVSRRLRRIRSLGSPHGRRD